MVSCLIPRKWFMCLFRLTDEEVDIIAEALDRIPANHYRRVQSQKLITDLNRLATNRRDKAMAKRYYRGGPSIPCASPMRCAI